MLLQKQIPLVNNLVAHNRSVFNGSIPLRRKWVGILLKGTRLLLSHCCNQIRAY